MPKQSSSKDRYKSFSYPFASKSSHSKMSTQECSDKVKVLLEEELKLTEADRIKLSSRGFEVGKLIGQGGWSQVFLASFFKKPCAVKELIWIFHEEIQTIKKIRHPHIVQMFDLYVTEDRSLLVFMELMEGGELSQLFLQNQVSFSEDQARHYYLQFGDALRYMHSVGFHHGGIFSRNILLDRTKQVCKVADFTHSGPFYDPLTGQDKEWDTHMKDVYQAGNLLYAMLNPTEYVEQYTYETVRVYFFRIECYESVSIRLDPTFTNSNFSPEARQITSAHLIVPACERPSFEQILLNQPWLKMASDELFNFDFISN